LEIKVHHHNHASLEEWTAHPFSTIFGGHSDHRN
jgi:hypothetical protein